MDAFDANIWWSFLRIILVLGILTPIIYYVTRWYGTKQLQGTNIKIKDNISLRNNCNLCVVEWKGNEYLLGVTAQQIQLLQQKEVNSTYKETEE